MYSMYTGDLSKVDREAVTLNQKIAVWLRHNAIWTARQTEELG
jgi:hypothetical protein